MNFKSLKISSILQLIVELTSLLTIVYWWLGYSPESSISTKLNTAFCILLISLQLRLLKKSFIKQLWIPLFLITIIISSLSLIENITSFQFGIDTMLFIGKPIHQFHLMSIGTAISFIAFSVVIVLISFRKAKLILMAILISYIIAFNSFLVFIGRAYSISAESFPSYLSTESLLTASLFLMLVVVISIRNHWSILMSALFKRTYYHRFPKRLIRLYFTIILLVGVLVIVNIQMENMAWQFGIVLLTGSVITISLLFSLYNSRNLYFLNKQIVSINERLEESNKELNHSNETNTYLIKEIHHRIKNNLQMLSSIMSIQSSDSDSLLLQNFIRETKLRILSIGKIHEQLLQSNSINTLDIKEYLSSLSDDLITSSSTFNHTVVIEMENFEFTMDRILCLGFITNEIIANIIKYAYPDGTGIIEINLSKRNEIYHYSIRDYGQWVPAQDSDIKPPSFGQEIIEVFVQQLHGNLHVAHDNGTEFNITFQE